MTYANLVADFSQIGVSQDAFLSEAEMLNALNKLLRKRGVPSSFNEQLHKQLWDQCPKSSDNMVAVSHYLKIIIDAKAILEDRIKLTQKKLTAKIQERKILERDAQLARGTGDQRKAKQLAERLSRLDGQINTEEEDFKDYDLDLKNLLQPFVKEDISYRQSSLALTPLLENGYQPANRTSSQISQRNHSQIFFRRSSATLMMLFFFSLAFLLVELLLMTHKYHFFSLLCALALVAIFGLNYFDKTYIRFVIVLLFTSIISDLIWLILKAGALWSPGDFSEDSRLNIPWYRLMIFILIGEMVLKLVIGFILLSYWNNKEVQSINLCGYTITLSGDSSNNLITICLENAFVKS